MIWVGVLIATIAAEAQPAQSATTSEDFVYLSDVIYGISQYQLNYGKMIGIDATDYPLWPKPVPGAKLSIAGKEYAKGVGAPYGEVILALDGEYSAFEAEVGLQTGEKGTVVFRVKVDGQEVFNSGEMKGGDAAKKVSVPLEGAQLMVLDATSNVHVVWGDARLYKAKDQAAPEPPDMAAFGRVATWDPARKHGVTVDRLTEFPANDVFLETEIARDDRDAYTVPVAANGEGCIGQQWLEARRFRKIGIEFDSDSPLPDPKTARVEGWVKKDPFVLDGYSPWQGKWIPIEGAIEVDGRTWRLAIQGAANRETAQGTYKVRWIFPGAPAGIRVRRFIAGTTSRYAETDIVVERVAGNGGKGELEIYNGEFVSPEASGKSGGLGWDIKDPLRVKLRYTTPRPWLLDRTVLQVRAPECNFGVTVDDVLAQGIVYVGPAGLCFRRADYALTALDHVKSVEPNRTVLEQVRSMPDQTLAKAMEVNYLAMQDRSPTMLSLPADNRKVIVQRSGEVGFGPTYLDFVQQRSTHRIAPTFGTGEQHAFPDSGVASHPGYSRTLEDGWLPMPHIRVEEAGIAYHEVVFVAPWSAAGATAPPGYIHPTPLCLAAYTVENISSAAAPASLVLTFTADAQNAKPAVVENREGRYVVTKDQHILAVVDAPPAPLVSEIDGDKLRIHGECPAGSSLSFHAYMPMEWATAPENPDALNDGAALRKQTEAYWRKWIAAAMQVEVPEPLLVDLIRASQINCTLAARNEDDGRKIDPWISSSYYASLDTESHAITYGMDLWGQHDFARRAFEFFIARYKPEGYLSHGYTLMGTGQHLWWMSDHFRLTGDDKWWGEVAPGIAKMAGWVAAQAEKTKHVDANGNKVPEYGLMPPGTVADWQDWGYTYSLNGYYYAGLNSAAEALTAIGTPEATDYAKAAKEMRENILRAYAWTQARTPVVPRGDGVWIPGSPFQALCPGPSPQFFPNYFGSWLYDEELGAHQMIDEGVLAPHSADADYVADYLEGTQLINNELGVISAEATRKDWFDRGGFGRAQPFYARNVQMHARRDDVKPFIRSFFNQLGVMVNKEDLTIYENPGASVWNKTFETGNFLQQARTMFVMERGKELWLAPFVTSNWLHDGMRVAVKQAPTFFGDVAYSITSHVKDGFIEATVERPTRTKPDAIVLRVRHPEGKPMTSVTVNGHPHAAFDATKETVNLEPNGVSNVKISY